jgi:hypothetical protein
MLADIAQMNSMQPINDDVLFSPAPTPGELATLSLPLGSALWPTWSPGAPNTGGTILGPAGATVPSLPPAGSMIAVSGGVSSTLGPSSVGSAGQTISSLTANGAVGANGAASSSDGTSLYGGGDTPFDLSSWGGNVPPAGSMDDASFSGRPLGPISFLSPWPTIVKPSGYSSTPAAPSFWCEVANWVSANPGLAALSTLGVYLALRGKRK